MRTIRQLLCATDLSTGSEPAWAEAQLLARLLHAEILLLHVVPVPSLPPDAYLPARVYQQVRDAAYQEARDGLAPLVERAAASGVKARTRIEEGPVAHRILAVAREESADLLVMGTHGRTDFGRIILGSVADRVVRLAPVPVLTVRAQLAGQGRDLRRLCYATDFSAAARTAWPWAVALAEASGAEIDLLHVTPDVVPGGDATAEAVGEMSMLLHRRAEEAAERFLHEAGLARQRVHVLIGRGAVGDQVARWAEERDADLIVMGAHGWSGIVRWTLGSVAHRVIQVAPCPVLTVGPPEEPARPEPSALPAR